MSFIGKLVLFCLLMAVFQRAIAVLLALLALVWIYGFITKPAETIGFLFLLTLAACIRAYPGWSLMGIVVIILIICFCNAKSGESGQ